MIDRLQFDKNKIDFHCDVQCHAVSPAERQERAVRH